MLAKEILFGVAVGDALGVPVEFQSRREIAVNPVTDMRGYGTYNLPAGTWSDDSSLTFCLAEALTTSYDLQNIANNFKNWFHHSVWTPHGTVFDIGIATRKAIHELDRGCDPRFAGGMDEQSNGNGSLMRILPLVIYIKDKSPEERFQITKDVSSITHAHIRSVLCCFYYLEFARLLITGNSPTTAYEILKTEFASFLRDHQINQRETLHFDALLKGNIALQPEDEIFSSGYVVHTLHASIWCLLTTNSYSAAVLKAVNLGEDTDTTGAVTGGLAALHYGFRNIPAFWIDQLARRQDILNLASRLDEVYGMS